MLSSFAVRLKALSPLQLALLVLVALAVLGSSTAVASNLITGADVKDRSLTGRDLAPATVTHTNLDNETVLSQDIRDGHVLSRDLKDGTVQPADLSPDARAQLAESGTGGGAKGEKGDTGAQGPTGDTGAVGAPGGFMVIDADNTTVGPLVYARANSTSSGTFFYRGRLFNADFRTGALQIPATTTFYTTPDCSGTPYMQGTNYTQSVFKGTHDPDNLYEATGELETLNMKTYRSGANCVDYDFARDVVPMELVSAAVMPPPLRGPLRIVPAN